MKPMNSQRGITLMELMVVIAIMGILSTVAMPKFFGTAEKAREKIDLMKLYDLRNALNLALIEDIGAMEVYDPVTGVNRAQMSKDLNAGLSSNIGATLFVIELHSNLSINVQGSHGSANDKIGNQNINICKMIGDGGTFYSALRDANFDGVADIIEARLKGVNNYKNGGDTYSSKPYIGSDGKTTYYRTAPIRKLFQSQALNVGTIKDNKRYSLSLRWTDPDDPYSIEVYLLENGHQWNDAYKSDYGTCFSTYGRRGCSYKKKK